MSRRYRLPYWRQHPETQSASSLAAEDKYDWWHNLLGLPEHWKASQGKNVKILVGDTGRPTHFDVKDAIVASKNFATDSRTDEDLIGHSTHVCGILGGRLNGKGSAGMAPECEILIGKCLGDDGSGWMEDIANMIYWGIEQKVDIISMSLGGPEDPTLYKAIRAAYEAGVCLIAAAGNEGDWGIQDSTDWPGRYEEVIMVGSYNEQGRISDFSSRGMGVDVACPGENILSCWLGGRYRRLDGTSMATPMMAGMAANLISLHKAAIERGDEVGTPINNNDDLREHIMRATVDIMEPGKDRDSGWGIIDMSKWLRQEPPPATEPAPRPAPSPITDAEAFSGVRMKYPVEFDGQRGVFLYPSTSP